MAERVIARANDRADERGFGLIEVLACTALLVLGCAFALALVPAVAHRSQAHVMREAALGIARNALERARAAAAYLPPGAMADPAQRDATAQTHAWALHPAASYASNVRFDRALCGRTGASADVEVDVALAYDASAGRLRATVTYPPDPCVAATRAEVALETVLAPAALAPQTRMPDAIADPDTQ